MKELMSMGIIFGGLIWLWVSVDNPLGYWLLVLLLISIVALELLFPLKKKTKPQSNAEQSSEESAHRQAKPVPVYRERSDEEILAVELSELNEHEFERLIAMYYKEKGYNAQRVNGTGVHNIDLILTDPKDNMRIAVQCNHWKTKHVGNDTILRLCAEKRIHKCLDAWCITTSSYTKSAEEAAAGLNIELLDGHHVRDFIGNWQKRKRMLAARRKNTLV